MSDHIKPALTPKEWETSLAYGRGGRGVDGVFEGTDANQEHYIAALALNGQSFGFTWDDVDEIENAAQFCETIQSQPGVRELRDLKARISALLPPRNPNP